MKKIFYALMVLAFTAGCSGNASQETAQNADSTEVAESAPVIDTTKTYTDVLIKIEGMTCTGCENTVVKALKGTEGVVDAAASYIDGVAKAKFDPAVSSNDALKKAIEAKGYKVVSVEIP